MKIKEINFEAVSIDEITEYHIVVLRKIFGEKTKEILVKIGTNYYFVNLNSPLRNSTTRMGMHQVITTTLQPFLSQDCELEVFENFTDAYNWLNEND